MLEISEAIKNVKKFPIYTPSLSSPSLTELEEIIGDAIKRDVLEFDEEIHLTLSGGTDTSLLATLIKKNYPRRKINAYTICKPDSPDLYFSSIVAEALKLNHIEEIIDEQEAIKYIDEFKKIIKVTGLDVERFRGNRLIWIFLYKTISKYTNKIISGDGPDELFGVYPPHLNPRIIRENPRYYVKKMDQEEKKLIKEAEKGSLTAVFKYYWKIMPDSYLIPQQKFSEFFNIKTFLPYLDERVIKITSQIPFEQRVDSNEGKKPLKQILKKYLPENVVDREKTGLSKTFPWIDHLIK